MTAMIIGIARRFVSSIGLLTPARPQITIATPDIGLIVLPRAPAKAAIVPKVGTVMPKLGAWGVTASLNANAAASPEPVITPITKGPSEPPQRAISFEPRRTSMKTAIRPDAFKPAAKTPAAIMMPRTSP